MATPRKKSGRQEQERKQIHRHYLTTTETVKQEIDDEPNLELSRQDTNLRDFCELG